MASESLLQKLDQLRSEFEEQIQNIDTEPQLANFKASFLGKKGRLTEILKDLGKASPEEKPQLGAKINEVKKSIETGCENSLAQIKNRAIEAKLAQDAQFDPTLPGFPFSLGHRHPLTQIFEEARSIFEQLGFFTFSGPEIEDEFHNFEALNIPSNHPARDLQDTFYLPGGWLLRTHTSTVQIHVMQAQKPPLRMIAPGAVYRCDSDVTHTPMFHQIEGLWVDENVNFRHLKGVLTLFVQKMFGSQTKLRFRSSFFPFTEPSAEVDMSCVFCSGKTSCPVCKGTGWLEILGCGMVDPAVFKFVDYDAEKYRGFAFGIGLERLTMLKFGINDLRLFYENDARFLEQF